MNLDHALEHAATGDSILFIGAGFSVGATNTKDKPFKSGKALAQFLSARCGLPEETPLEDSAEIFAAQFGVDELIKELRREYTAKEVSDAHRTLAALPWKRTYTTNYDNVFETSTIAMGKIVVPVGPDSKVHLTAKGDPLCIHLNGYIDTLNRNTIWTSFKLTDTSYSTASIERSEWAALFRQDVRFARSVFFVGYSLFDIDIKRILKSTPDLTEKTFFIQHETVDQVTEARALRFGQILKIGTDGLAEKIESGKYLIPRKSIDLNIGRSIVEYQPPSNTRVAKDREFLDLMMLGEFNHELSAPDPTNPSLYNCERNIVSKIIDRIDRGGLRAAALYSEIANGRTICMALIAKHAVARGWRVFEASELSDHAKVELRAIAELPGKVLLLVDDYVGWLPQMGGVVQLAGDQFTVLTAARGNAHDIAGEDLEEILAPHPVEEFNLDILTEDELAWWVQTLDTYGLWAELAGKSPEAKTRYLADNCGRHIQGILLKVFDSPIIRKRLEKAAVQIKSDPLVEKIAITIFTLTILNQRPTVDMITDIWGVDAFDRESVQSNSGLANFVDISRSSIRVRSTAAADFLLKNFWTADEVVSAVLEIARAADRLYRVSIKYEGVFKTLMRFSAIQQAIPEKGKRDAVISYYENLKLIDRCQRYPLFWLQYAIGALVIGDLSRARRYFDTSYALSEKAGWDTFQIDNHYARYLLVLAAEEAPFEDAIKFFREARTLINRQIKDEKLHYPFRVAKTYQEFFDRFQSKFSESELKEISQAAETVADRIDLLPSERANNKYVRKCKVAMTYIVETIATRLGVP